MKNYRVMRYYEHKGNFTSFRKLQAWLCENDPTNAELYMSCKRIHTKHYNQYALNWAVCLTEYCAIKLNTPEN